MLEYDHHLLLKAIRGCTLCQVDLPLGPRPIVQFSPLSKILIIGQAPGLAVHESGIPWHDPSGDRMREWLGINKDTFFDPEQIALVPMGFCYPGRREKGGDNPPRVECAPTWHEKVLALTHSVELTILTGSYAQQAYMMGVASLTMTGRVKAWRDVAPKLMPLPHPSWRVVGWMKKNRWFEQELLPFLKTTVQTALG